MEQKTELNSDTVAARAQRTLVDTVRELLSTDSMLKKLIGISTAEELYFFSAVIAFGRFTRGDDMCQAAKRASFHGFLETCKPVRNDVLVMLSEKSLGLTKRKKTHFSPCKRRGYM